MQNNRKYEITGFFSPLIMNVCCVLQDKLLRMSLDYTKVELAWTFHNWQKGKKSYLKGKIIKEKYFTSYKKNQQRQEVTKVYDGAKGLGRKAKGIGDSKVTNPHYDDRLFKQA